MKKMVLVLSLFIGVQVVFAAENVIPVETFRKLEMFNYVYVEKAELTFRDELSQEDIYQVTYLVEGDCASSGNADACGLVPYCEYVIVDTILNEFIGTQVDCSEDIEVVIGDPELIDEL